MTRENEKPLSPQLSEYYMWDQEKLRYALAQICQEFDIPPLQPEQYVLNVGCGGSADYPAAQVFGDPQNQSPIPVVATDIILNDAHHDDIHDNLLRSDLVTILQGDACDTVPQIVKDHGQPGLVLVRNPDAFLDPNIFSSKGNEYIGQGWAQVFKTIYDNIADGTHVVITYKNSQELVPLCAQLSDAGFFIFTYESPQRLEKGFYRLLKTLTNFWEGRSEPSVRPDQFALVATKDIPDNMLSHLRTTLHMPDLTREMVLNGARLDKLEYEQEAKKASFKKALEQINETLTDKLSRTDAMAILTTFMDNQEHTISPEDKTMLDDLTKTPAKLQFLFRSLDEYKEYPDSLPVKGSLLHREKNGMAFRLIGKASNTMPGTGIIVQRYTVYFFSDDPQQSTSSEFLDDGEKVLYEILQVYVSEEHVETIQQIMEEANNSDTTYR